CRSQCELQDGGEHLLATAPEAGREKSSGIGTYCSPIARGKLVPKSALPKPPGQNCKKVPRRVTPKNHFMNCRGGSEKAHNCTDLKRCRFGVNGWVLLGSSNSYFADD